MCGYSRLKPTVIPKGDRRADTCSTLGCPSPAVLRVPLNQTIFNRFEDFGHYSARPVYHTSDEATRYAPSGLQHLEMRLCRQCVRTFATALPPGQRLVGARLRYPELGTEDDPETGRRRLAAAEDIEGTPEYAAFHVAREPERGPERGPEPEWGPYGWGNSFYRAEKAPASRARPSGASRAARPSRAPVRRVFRYPLIRRESRGRRYVGTGLWGVRSGV